MDFLRNNRRFGFLLGGKKPEDCGCTVSRFEDGDMLCETYVFPSGLRVTNTARRYGDFGAYEWVNRFENTADAPSEVISELWDADFSMPLAHEDTHRHTAFVPDIEKATRIFAPAGSTWSTDEFYCDVDLRREGDCVNHIRPGSTKKYTASGGRSSSARAPFFNVSKNGGGVIFAIGWTGQWCCEISRGEDSVTVKSGIEGTSFRLLPGESIRTSSIVVMPYTGSVNDSQNKWRRLVKEHFSLIGNPGRDSHGPFCAGIWGGMPTADVLKRVDIMAKNALQTENVWMDAGWYGADTEPTPDEFEGDWHAHTGDWVVSPKIHPGGLTDVTAAVHKNGMKFILWLEPERVIDGTPATKAHPEYFLRREGESRNLLLNLGKDEAWSYCFETLCSVIEKLGVDFYRQDFNIEPLGFWRQNDAPDRQGITEIKHINGLYALWDALLEKFPHLMIDNCSSGGRRIDIETLRRSVPLWRSDYMCPANFDTVAAQCHNHSFNTWLPYSGTGTGRLYDLYRVRSCYAAALTTNYAFSQRDDYGNDPEKLDFIRSLATEYKKVRPYFSEDFYPLTEHSDRTDVWCASQLDRPSQRDGVLQVFRREASPYTTAVLRLNKIDENAVYTFTDADGGAFAVSGGELAAKGLKLTIDEPRTAKLFFYSAGK